MLNSRKRVEKTHEQMMEDVYSEIPIYSEEWTNYNPSDPGITILENLTAFLLLQYEQLDDRDTRVQQQLLKMVGFEPGKGSPARVLLEPIGLRETLILPANQRFRVDDMSFETTKERKLEPCHIIGLYTNQNGSYKDYSYVLDPEILIGANIFGDAPEEGMEVYIVMDQTPPPMTDSIFYLKTTGEYDRNPPEEKNRNRLAQIVWECYTTEGFVPMNVKDETDGFLLDGEIRFRMPEQQAEPYQKNGIEGYVFRGTLKKAQYDIPPRIQRLSGFLLEVWQKDTQAIVYTFPKGNEIEVNSELMEQEHYKVLCKEEKGSSYRMYQEVWAESGTGRYYTVTHDAASRYTIHFNKREFGYGPERLKHAVKVIVYNGKLANRYYLGRVLGYDDQILELPEKNLAIDSFSILAKRRLEDGSEIYDFVKPNRRGEGELQYYLYENEGKIQILDAGEFIGAELYLASIAVIRGSEGNIREGNTFIAEGIAGQAAEFRNPAAGSGGAYMETIEDTRRRYVQDIYKPYTAVSATDYETLVMSTPGLCIHKVKAYMNYERNLVQVAVKPYSLERFPILSRDYRRLIRSRLEQCRLLSTRIEILQPVYLPIQVRCVAYVHKHYDHCREQIEQKLREELDYITGGQEFGQILRFDTIFRKLEQLECVAQIYDLTLTPQNRNLAVCQGADIIPKVNCLCYPGSITLELHTQDTEN